MDLEAISGMLPLIDKMLSRFGTHDKVKVKAISLPKVEEVD
jgi:ribosomal protein L20A (L18A)